MFRPYPVIYKGISDKLKEGAVCWRIDKGIFTRSLEPNATHIIDESDNYQTLEHFPAIEFLFKNNYSSNIISKFQSSTIIGRYDDNIIVESTYLFEIYHTDRDTEQLTVTFRRTEKEKNYDSIRLVNSRQKRKNVTDT